MIVKVDFKEDDIQPALQQHLDGGCGVPEYLCRALRYYNRALEHARAGSKVRIVGAKDKYLLAKFLEPDHFDPDMPSLRSEP